MNVNPYLSNYSQDDILSLYSSGSIQPRIDESANLILENTSSLFVSSITIPLKNTQANNVKVETKYSVAFTEL
jgi:hypothetical protein